VLAARNDLVVLDLDDQRRRLDARDVRPESNLSCRIQPTGIIGKAALGDALEAVVGRHQHELLDRARARHLHRDAAAEAAADHRHARMAAATWSNSAKASAISALSLGRPARRRSPGSEAGRGVLGKDAAQPGRLDETSSELPPK
jgi:hypothetical protein